MTLRLRLILGLAAVALLLAFPLGLALRALDRAEQAADALRRQEVAASLLLGRVREVEEDLRRADNAVAALPDDPRGAQFLAFSTARLRALGDSLRPYALPVLNAQITRTVATLEVDGAAEAAAAAAHRTDEADRISRERVAPGLEALDRAFSDASRTINARSQVQAAEAAEAAANARQQAVLLLAAATAGALAVSVWLTRSISGPVRALERGLAAVAGGDFTHALGVRASRRDEFGRLAGSFEQMAEKLAELDRLKAAFVSVASHELKTPINVILGYLTLLSDGIYGKVPEEQQGVLATIERQGQTLSRLVQHLLDVSRFEAGVARLELRPVVLRPILHEAEQAHAVLARQRGVAFRTLFASELPDVVTWDADRMREVLDNLLTNAVKFTPAGGTVELAAAPDRRRAPPSVRITVRDSGVGIAPEQLPRVFEKFYQADNQDAAATKGTGLGLSIVKEIVEAHGGTIGVKSTPSAGTVFTVVLPRTAPDAALLNTAERVVGGPASADEDDAPELAESTS